MRKKTWNSLNVFTHTALVVGLAVFFAACSWDIGDWDISRSESSRANTNAFVDVDFFDGAYPLVFGTSARSDENQVRGPGERSWFEDDRTVPPVVVDNIYRGTVPADAYEIVSEVGRGKIAGSEDGLVFFFREVDRSRNFIMEADFEILTFGSAGGSNSIQNPGANGQEGWGIMVRDFVPQFPGFTFADWDARSASGRMLNQANATAYFVGHSSTGNDSNMIMAGGVKRGVRAYWREGVRRNPELLTDAFGNPTVPGNQDAGNFRFRYTPLELGDYSAFPTMADRPDFPRWGSTWRVRLEKTNSGFRYRMQPLDDYWIDPETGGRSLKPAVEGIVPLFDIVDSVNRERYYVGLFAARNAAVRVRNIRYQEADASRLAPALPSEPIRINAEVTVLSPEIWSGENYLYIRSNVRGNLSVTQGNTIIASNLIFREDIIETQNGAARPLTLFTVPIQEPREGDNVFSWAFFPVGLPTNASADQVLGSSGAITGNFLLHRRTFHNGTGNIYVAPGASVRGAGTRGDPLDLQTAILHCQPGQTIVMLNGSYRMDRELVIPRYNNGTASQPKTLRAETRDRVWLDWGKDEQLALRGILRGQGFLVAGSYWTLDGFHVRGTPDKVKGIVISGHNNTVRYVMTYNNGDTGLQISGSASDPVRFWPSGNRIEFSESFHNRDAAETDADGFAAKLTVGRNNVFNWVISHSNNDDGWDLFAKKDTGPTGAVRIFNSISYRQGFMLGGHRTRAGHNGFKMGGEGIAVRHEIHNSLSFANGQGDAVSSNSNPALVVSRTTAIDSNGNSLGRFNIYAGDNTVTPSGRVTDSVGRVRIGADRPTQGTIPANTDWRSVMVTRPAEFWGSGYAGIDVNTGQPHDYRDFVQYKMFLERNDQGIPMLGNLYRSASGGHDFVNPPNLHGR